MNNETLFSRFLASNGKPVHFNGQTVRGSAEFTIDKPTQIQIELLFAKSYSEFTQGLFVHIKKGKLNDRGELFRSIYSLFDSKPWYMAAESPRKQTPNTFFVGPIWRWNDGTVQYGLQNSGVIIEEGAREGENVTILRCSPGPIPEPDFDAFVVAVKLVPLAEEK